MSQPPASSHNPEAGSQKPAASRTQFILVVAVVLLYWSALYLYVPTLPVYVETKTELLEMVGVVIAMYGLWQALLRLRALHAVNAQIAGRHLCLAALRVDGAAGGAGSLGGGIHHPGRARRCHGTGHQHRRRPPGSCRYRGDIRYHDGEGS